MNQFCNPLFCLCAVSSSHLLVVREDGTEVSSKGEACKPLPHLTPHQFTSTFNFMYVYFVTSVQLAMRQIMTAVRRSTVAATAMVERRRKERMGRGKVKEKEKMRV